MSKQLLKQLVDLNNMIQEQHDDQVGNIQASQFDNICREFLEKGKMLEPIIQIIFDKFIQNLKKDLQEQKINHTFQYVPIYTLIDVRGLRYFERYLPTDVAMLELLIITIHNICASNNSQKNNQQDSRQMPSTDKLRSLTNMQSGFIGTNNQNQEAKSLFNTKYVLFVILGRLIQCPFDWQDMDTKGDLTQLLLQSCEIFRGSSSKLTSMSNEVLGRFLSRKDQANTRQEIIDQINKYLDDKISSGGKITLRNASEIAGNVQLLSFISRFGVSVGSRIEVLKQPFQQLQWLLNSKNREIIKISVVIAARGAQSFLTKQYQRANVENIDFVSELQGFSVPQQFDLYIDALLQLLGDSDPFVRSTAAFGLSNTLLYLPNMFTDEILETILDMCGPANTPDEWAGALLTLSNAIRLRLLLPKRVPDLGNIIIAGLNNNFSKQSSMVKDAACFCVWSLARAYKANEVDIETIQSITAAIAATSITEREISARRSAAAAFQELAGRLKDPIVPNAIKCAGILDYYELGDSKYCHTVLGPQLALQHEIYRARILRNIMDHGLEGLQWAHRDQSAQLLAIVFIPQTDSWVIPELLQFLGHQDDWALWCGAAQTLTQIIEKYLANQSDISQLFDLQQQQELNILAENVMKNQKDPTVADGLYQIIQATCALAASIINSNISSIEYDTIYHYLSKYVQVTVRHYLKDVAIQNYDRLFENSALKLLQYLWQDKDVNPKQLTMDRLSQVACVSCINLEEQKGSFFCAQNEKQKKLASILLEQLEQHKSAADNVSRLFILKCIQNNINYIKFTEQGTGQILKILQLCAQDYSIDNRGEVGMVVRHFCLHVLKTLFFKVNNDQNIAKIKEMEPYRLLAATYHMLIARFCCSKVETLRVLGIETMIIEYKCRSLQVCKAGQTTLDTIYDIIQKQNASLNENTQQVEKEDELNINDKFCDLNDLTQEQQRKQLEQYNFEVLQRSYEVIRKVFVADPRFKKIAITCLIQNITFASQEDLEYIIQIFKTQKREDIYNIIVNNLEKITNKGLEGALQYACLQMINYLIYFGVEPPENLVSKIIEKICRYIEQTQINFHSFAVSFSILEHFIVTSNDQNIVTNAYKVLFDYLTNPTPKVRENAADALRCCAIRLQKFTPQMCIDDWINMTESEVVAQQKVFAKLLGIENIIS